MKRTGADHLLRTISREPHDELERDAQAAALADFIDRPRPATWRVR